MKFKVKYKILFPITLILLAISIYLNSYLYKQLKLYIQVLYSVELDPLGLSSFQDETPPPGDKPLVVFFGDSRAEFWKAPNSDDFIFINRGLGNQTSAQIINRFDEHVRSLQPDVIIIQMCINDLKTIPLFPDNEQEIISNCEANLQKVVQDSLNINSTVIITTVIPPTGDIPLSRRMTAWSDNVYTAIDEVNSFILNMSGERLIVFDTAKLISDDQGKTKIELSSDHLHLNQAGYAILNRELEKILSELK